MLTGKQGSSSSKGPCFDPWITWQAHLLLGVEALDSGARQAAQAAYLGEHRFRLQAELASHRSLLRLWDPRIATNRAHMGLFCFCFGGGILKLSGDAWASDPLHFEVLDGNEA